MKPGGVPARLLRLVSRPEAIRPRPIDDIVGPLSVITFLVP
jgi:hypothetical protein